MIAGRKASLRCSILLVAFGLIQATFAVATGVPVASVARITGGDLPFHCEQTTAAGRILAQPAAASGDLLPGLIVLDPATGDDIGQIDVEGVVEGAYPTSLPNWALVSTADQLFLVDAEALTATEIAFDSKVAAELEANPTQFRGSAGTRFVLLGTPTFELAYLIDLETGAATHLGGLIDTEQPGASPIVSFAAVTPDDAHVVMWDGRHVYIAPTHNPTAAHRIDERDFAFAPDFSPDGTELIFSESDGPGTGSDLVLADFDGSSRRVVASSPQALVTLWVPNSRTILVDERTESGAAAGSVWLLDLDSGEEMPLLDYTGSLTTVQFNPSGTRALLGEERMDGGTWHLADLTTGTVGPLDLLEGSRVLPGLYGDSRWALAVPFGQVGGPLDRAAYRGIDLETGAVARLLQPPAGSDFPLEPALSPDGRFALVTGVSDDGMALWLLDAAEVRATELARSGSITGLFSPDGCHAAVTISGSGDGENGVSLLVVSVNGDVVAHELDAIALAWVPSETP